MSTATTTVVPTAPIQSLGILMRALKLPAFSRYAEEVAQKAEREGWTFGQYLHHLAELEVHERRRRRTERFLKAADRPPEKTLATLTRARLPPKVAKLLPTLCEGAFVERGDNILAFGLPGRGKTHLVCAARSFRAAAVGRLLEAGLSRKKCRRRRLLRSSGAAALTVDRHAHSLAEELREALGALAEDRHAMPLRPLLPLLLLVLPALVGSEAHLEDRLSACRDAELRVSRTWPNVVLSAPDRRWPRRPVGPFSPLITEGS